MKVIPRYKPPSGQIPFHKQIGVKESQCYDFSGKKSGWTDPELNWTDYTHLLTQGMYVYIYSMLPLSAYYGKLLQLELFLLPEASRLARGTRQPKTIRNLNTDSQELKINPSVVEWMKNRHGVGSPASSVIDPYTRWGASSPLLKLHASRMQINK